MRDNMKPDAVQPSSESRHAGGGRRIARDFARLAWCAGGAAAAIGLALWCAGAPSSPIFLASLGGSTLFLFGLTRTATAQPRALVGGHLGSAFIGIVCFQMFGDALWVYVLALVLSLVLSSSLVPSIALGVAETVEPMAAPKSTNSTATSR